MPSPPSSPFVLGRLELKNVRCFEQLTMEFVSRPRTRGQWTVLLGDNGVGKSTLLKAIGLAAFEQGNLLQSYPEGKLLREGEVEGRINLKTANGNLVADVGLPLHMRSHNGYPFPVFAYGAGRGSALAGPERHVDFENPFGPVCTLFGQPPGLIHAETWLRNLEFGALKGDGVDVGFFQAVRDTLLSLMPGVDTLTIPPRGDVRVSGPAVGNATLSTLSDGYVTTLSWVTDLIARWSEWARMLGMPLNGDFQGQMRGLILVDELDLHLHPRWQTQVIANLRNAFPNLSFVVTTHNPLTLHGAEKGEVYVLRRDGNEQVQVEQIDLREGLDSDDVLTGPWFDLPSTLDSGTLRFIERYQRQVRKIPSEPVVLARMERELIQRLGGTRLHETVTRQTLENAGPQLRTLFEES